MKRFLLVVFVLCLAACSQPAEEKTSSPGNPKTLYGQSVKKARDLQKPSAQDEETSRQAKELLETD